MTKIIFPFQVKYKEKYIPSNLAFEAEDKDKKELLKMGGKTADEDKKEPKGEENEPAAKIEDSNSKRAK